MYVKRKCTNAKINLRKWRARCNDARHVAQNCSGLAANLQYIFERSSERCLAAIDAEEKQTE